MLAFWEGLSAEVAAWLCSRLGPVAMNVKVCTWHQWEMQSVFLDLVSGAFMETFTPRLAMNQWPDYQLATITRVVGEFNRRGLGWFVAGGWFRCNEFQLNFSTKTNFQQPRSCSASAEECHVLDLSQGDSRPVQVMPVPSRPRRGFSQTSLEKLTVVELKKMCKERTVKMPSLGERMGFSTWDSWWNLQAFWRNDTRNMLFLVVATQRRPCAL